MMGERLYDPRLYGDVLALKSENSKSVLAKLVGATLVFELKTFRCLCLEIRFGKTLHFHVSGWVTLVMGERLYDHDISMFWP